MLRVAGDRDHVDGVRLVRVHVDREPEVGRQVPADLVPRLARVIAAHDVPVLLHVQHRRAGRMHREAVHAVPHLRAGVRDARRSQAVVDRPPGLAAVIGPERPRRRDRGEHPARRGRVQDDRVQAHPARARLPGRPGLMPAQPGQFLPGPAAVRRPEQPGVLHPGVDRIRIRQRRLQVPDPRELPPMRRPVIPLVRPGDTVVGEPAARRLPGHAAVIGTLDHLPRPAAALRGVHPARVRRRPLDVVDLPPGEMRPADIPPLTLAIRAQHERALARTHQQPYATHLHSPSASARRGGPPGPPGA